MDQSKRSWVSATLKFVVPLVVTVGLCWIMLRNIDYRDMLRVIADQCDFRWIAAGMALSVLSHVIRAGRWGIQLRALGMRPTLWELTLSIFGTYAVNLVFPRLGEIWRSEFIAHRENSEFSTVFGSMVAERVADLAAALCLLVMAFGLSSGTIAEYLTQDNGVYSVVRGIFKSPLTWIAAAAGVAGLWWLMTRKTSGESLLGKIQGFARGIWKGFASIGSMPGKGRWLVLTVALWTCYFVQLYVAFFAFPFTREVIAHYGVTAALVTFVMSSIAMGVPSNGGIGPWQWAVMFGLGFYGVSQVDGAAFANLVLGCQTVLLIVLGIVTFISIMVGKKAGGR